MDNNIQRYKGNEGHPGYYGQHPPTPYNLIPDSEYLPEEYMYQTNPTLAYQNFQNSYRQPYPNPYESQNIYSEYMIDGISNTYPYQPNTPVVPSYNDTIGNANESMNIPQNNFNTSHYNEHTHTNSAYASFSSPARNSSNYRAIDQNIGNYYQDMAYQNVGANMHGYNPMIGHPGAHSEMASYYPSPGQISSPHRSHANTYLNPLPQSPSRFERPISPKHTESLREAFISSVRPKAALPQPKLASSQKILENKEPSSLSNINFKVSKVDKAPSPNLSQRSNTVDIPMSNKDFPALCETPKSSTTSSTLLQKTNSKPQSLDETPFRRRTTSTSVTLNSPKPTHVLPDIAQFASSFSPSISYSQPSGSTYGLTDLHNLFSKYPSYHPPEKLNKSAYSFPANPILGQSNQRITELDYPVPNEYLIYQSIREKLAKVDCKSYNDDLLFYIYYNEEDDWLKMSTIAHLYARKWRYHLGNKVWIKLSPNYSSGDVYSYFEPTIWECISSNKPIDKKQLEDNSYQKYLNYEACVVVVQNNLPHGTSNTENGSTNT